MSTASSVRALILGCGLLTGCGYTISPLVRPDARRIHLPLFENMTFYRDLEISLTRDVESELGSRPGFFIVPPDKADIVLKGTIENLRQRVLSEESGDRVRESSALTTVRVELRRASDGALIKEFRVSDRAEFFVPAGEDLDTATSESFVDLARKIVNELEEGFPRSTASPDRSAHQDSSDA